MCFSTYWHQSCYDGAALVWARHNALDLIGQPDLDDGQARPRVFTFNFYGSNLEAYACLRVKTDDGRVEYHQHLLKGVYMTGEYDNFKYGWTLLRNLQDLAQTESAGLRDLLQDYVAAPPRLSTPVQKGKVVRQLNPRAPSFDLPGVTVDYILVSHLHHRVVFLCTPPS
jgi:hypothetical protein